jgi:hypothetical protein
MQHLAEIIKEWVHILENKVSNYAHDGHYQVVNGLHLENLKVAHDGMNMKGIANLRLFDHIMPADISIQRNGPLIKVQLKPSTPDGDDHVVFDTLTITMDHTSEGHPHQIEGDLLFFQKMKTPLRLRLMWDHLKKELSLLKQSALQFDIPFSQDMGRIHAEIISVHLKKDPVWTLELDCDITYEDQPAIKQLIQTSLDNRTALRGYFWYRFNTHQMELDSHEKGHVVMGDSSVALSSVSIQFHNYMADDETVVSPYETKFALIGIGSTGRPTTLFDNVVNLGPLDVAISLQERRPGTCEVHIDGSAAIKFGKIELEAPAVWSPKSIYFESPSLHSPAPALAVPVAMHIYLRQVRLQMVTVGHHDEWAVNWGVDIAWLPETPPHTLYPADIRIVPPHPDYAGRLQILFKDPTKVPTSVKRRRTILQSAWGNDVPLGTTSVIELEKGTQSDWTILVRG